MKFHLLAASGQNLFTGYGEGYVMVNERRHEKSVIVLPDRVLQDWAATSFEALAEEHFETILSLEPEIVLLGTGATFRFPHARLTRALAEARIGLEAMDTFAACRTYNILMAEGRKVAAALIIGA
jgi:uncharacterized protein